MKEEGNGVTRHMFTYDTYSWMQQIGILDLNLVFENSVDKFVVISKTIRTFEFETCSLFEFGLKMFCDALKMYYVFPLRISEIIILENSKPI